MIDISCLNMNIVKFFRERIRLVVITCRMKYLRIYGMTIDSTARISWGTKLDKTNGGGIFIGEESYIASGAIVFAHDFSRGIHAKTIIGKQCFIGANAIIMPGITIGDNSIVGAGAVVTKDVPNNSIVAGNPAKVIREGIKTGMYGKLI